MTLLRHAGFLLLFAPSMWGDAALRYHTDVQASAVIPAAALDQALGGMRDMEIRIKGNKAYSTVGNLISIADLTSQGSILMDPAHRRFAEISSAQYGDQIQAALSTMPEQARAMLASLKMNLESRTTDRSATIQGIQTEEREFVLAARPLPRRSSKWSCRYGSPSQKRPSEYRLCRNLRGIEHRLVPP